MVKIIFIIIAAFFSFKIFKLKGVKKLPWFFAGILFFPPLVIITETPKMPFSRLMIYVLLLTMLIKGTGWYDQFKKFPLKVSLILLFILLMAVGIADDRLNYFLKFYRPLTYFLENFFVIFLTYFYIKNSKDALYIFNYLIIFFFIFSIYGILNYVTKTNQYNSFLADAFGTPDLSNGYNELNFSNRFRISSFTWHPIYYGFLVAEVILLGFFIVNGV